MKKSDLRTFICNFSISSGSPAAPSGNFFQYGQNLSLRAPNSAPRTGSKMSVLFRTNRVQSTIYAVRVTVSRPKRLQTVARFEKNYRMTPLVGLTISFEKLRDKYLRVHEKISSQF